MGRITNYRTDPDLCEILITRSFETMVWMRKKGVKFQASLRAAVVQGRRQIQVLGRPRGRNLGRRPGPGRTRAQGVRARRHQDSSTKRRRSACITDDNGVKRRAREAARGARSRSARRRSCSPAAVSNRTPKCARAISGPNWDLAKVRGTRYNTGARHPMALDSGALPYGHWSGCHAVGWDQNAPPFGDLAVGDNFQKHSYPLGHHGQRQRRALRRRRRGLPQLHLRQVRQGDPGPAGHVRVADLRQETPAHAARRIPDQAGDESHARTRSKNSSPSSTASTPKRCLRDAQGLQQGGADRRAVQPRDQGRPRHRRPHGAAKPTGRTCSTRRRSKPMRSPAASPSRFGGVKIDPANGQVEDVAGKPMPGLFAAGELVGGIVLSQLRRAAAASSRARCSAKWPARGAAACVK